MLGRTRTHPYLLVRNSLCGKRKQLEAVLNHNYWKPCLLPWALIAEPRFSHRLHASSSMGCGRAPAERPVRRQAELCPLTTKSPHLTYHLRQGIPFEGGKVSPHWDPGEITMAWKYTSIWKKKSHFYLSFHVLLKQTRQNKTLLL